MEPSVRKCRGSRRFQRPIGPAISLCCSSLITSWRACTIFVAVMVLCAVLLWRGTLFETRWALWLLLLCVPLPYIANTAGWVAAEVGRQPWLVYGLLRTSTGYSHMVSTGNGWFTLLGFMGLYTVLSI